MADETDQEIVLRDRTATDGAVYRIFQVGLGGLGEGDVGRQLPDGDVVVMGVSIGFVQGLDNKADVTAG